ncbi:mogroside IE synthase-like [Telopea speciosissima]|uniref:mogroside IE synthase-like n=1 Tax=Telopea speciosissima TaxID=54955 RepID=UPI001CC5ED32|nr:mogroside IE synthase-like [Telopea speciosissima]
MEKEGKEWKAQVIVFPFPVQGHINPMLQFSKRLFSKGLKVTLATTHFLLNHSTFQTQTQTTVTVEPISDGFDKGGMAEAASVEAYNDRFKAVGSETLFELIKKQRIPVKCLVYDSTLPWALDVAKKLGIAGASFFTQSCAVNSIYYHVKHGLLSLPVPGPTVSIDGLPLLQINDLPSFVSDLESYPSLLPIMLIQFSNLEEADFILFNTFDKLEDQVLNWMVKQWPIKTIGPTVPSMYSDKRIEGDTDYGFNLFKPSEDSIMNWLNNRETGSVIYVSFGTIAELKKEQMEELAFGLKESNYHFLWVVRESENKKLPNGFAEEIAEKGFMVPWCPQLEVLAHGAVGCFMTHCGWNSTIESLSLGVPVVAVPQWIDQTTNAKLTADVWEVGVRAGVDEKGIARREEIERCTREVMEGERGIEIRRNAMKWKELAKEAVDEDGSSDRNIKEFVDRLLCSRIDSSRPDSIGN